MVVIVNHGERLVMRRFSPKSQDKSYKCERGLTQQCLLTVHSEYRSQTKHQDHSDLGVGDQELLEICEI